MIVANIYWGFQLSDTVLRALYPLTHLILTMSYEGNKTGDNRDNSYLPYCIIMRIKEYMKSSYNWVHWEPGTG